jgi:sortase A
MTAVDIRLTALRRLGAASGRRVGQRVRAEVPVSVKVLTWALAGFAFVGVWLVLFAVAFSALPEAHAQHDLYNSFRAQLAAGTAPLSDAVPEGTPVALITAKQAGITGLVVVQGTSSSALQLGPGHAPGGPLPGQPGVSVIAGRATSYGAPFGQISVFSKGDRFDVTTAQGVFHYVVETVRRPGDAFPPLLAPGGTQLTLVTAEGDGWRSGWAPTHAVFVDAVLDGHAMVGNPAGGVATSADGLLRGDTRGMYPLVLWLQLLVVSVVGGIWARTRWGLWQSWLVAAPIALAALWGATTNAWLLFPNLL